jgi:signal transduction histidine kinase
LPSAEVRRAERAWFTPARDGLDAAWIGLVLVNLVAIALWPSWDTVPFHLIATGFAVLYALRLWPADPVLRGLGIVIITTFAGIGLDLLHNNESLEEAAEIPLLAAMFVAIVWHANRRIAADRERQLIGEKNSRLLEAQRRFLQDASHHLRTPITIALTHANFSPATSTAASCATSRRCWACRGRAASSRSPSPRRPRPGARTPSRRSGARRRRPRRWPGRRR